MCRASSSAAHQGAIEPRAEQVLIGDGRRSKQHRIWVVMGQRTPARPSDRGYGMAGRSWANPTSFLPVVSASLERLQLRNSIFFLQRYQDPTQTGALTLVQAHAQWRRRRRVWPLGRIWLWGARNIQRQRTTKLAGRLSGSASFAGDLLVV
jgi:hypothetical protein